ncbi:zinc finger CCCH domain-containing protein 13 isoform X1 [Diorhabda sublineata]|uniref:zinc finger CCCH domain-containing protein 13 isoform X1 n=2 Tax=Diorhabda sublineata TaxID=1163346 RepID=UPI0024E1103F|nr:zinc finger CCCH domain-containing protein 13 isoform X1 [Diorhabda sublineata]XP_056633274.1 zinc finger CCCH domain-containing protein 13 isoform X1 [Diorhabda sublineata]
MVVIVFVTDPSGRHLSYPKKRVTYSSRIFIKPSLFFEQVEPGETIATTKEEEWVSKKKTEVTNTKQIETRVKRQVVLEDGKVVEDSGPMVTTNTTEDSATQEHHQTELRKLGDDEVDGTKALEGGDKYIVDEKSNWVSVANPDGIVREVKERKVISREETEEVKETEDVQHFGDITDEAFLAAVNTGQSDLRKVLRIEKGGHQVVSTGPRVLVDTKKSKKTTDTEDVRELSAVREDGKIVTETQRTTEHEEVNDEELPEDAPVRDFQKESSQRYLKTREQEDVDYIADGVNIGHEMRFKTETMEADRRGDGVDEPDLFESLSARARRRANTRQPYRQRGLEEVASPLDRKDALTRKPLDFDQEEETRKVETSKWLEHHFGSDSRSSNNSTVEEEETPPKTSFFNVTIKSQPSRTEPVVPHNTFVSSIKETSRVYSPVEPERDRNQIGGYYKGINEWSEHRQHYHYNDQRHSPSYHTPSPYSGDRMRRSPSPDYRPSRSPVPDYRNQHSPTPDYARNQHSPIHDYPRNTRKSPNREIVTVTPTPPRRTKNERPRQRIVDDRSRYKSEYRNVRREDERSHILEHIEEPPPDYSPPSPPQMPSGKRQNQKTRFAVEPPPKPPKSGNIIGQSIRKLVGKIRSASAERKARQRAKRSPSPPSYQQGHVIDNIDHRNHVIDNNASSMERLDRPVQRYYLGEDPFGGSIYGRENKYEGAKPARNSRRREMVPEERRSQSTLGRFSKSTSRLVNGQHHLDERNSQTLPRHLPKQDSVPRCLNNKSNSTINVSIINTVSSPRKIEGPVKPQRTFKSNLSRSKSLNVHGGMYASNPQLNQPIGLKSPGLISSLNRSQKDINEDSYTSRFARNGISEHSENKRVFLSSLKDRAPELFKTLEEDDSYRNNRSYNGDIYEPPTRLRDTKVLPNNSVYRRGSASSTDFSEIYHTTTRNDNVHNPTVTNTTKSFSRRTIPSSNGRGVETIQSSETKITKSSQLRGGMEPGKYQQDRWYNSSGSRPVVIEVRNYK